ncbi:MAG: hypothetical protein U5K76_08860 [Woeseiaceae bacterium]|nr:hypothetical protein [Woeseiaceae bacterium]
MHAQGQHPARVRRERKAGAERGRRNGRDPAGQEDRCRAGRGTPPGRAPNGRELQRRQDQALLATYLSIDEIEMHRDRRIELFQAQARVTELYLRNLQRRLESLEEEASKYRPYSEDPDAPMVDPDLVADLNETRDTIKRHEANLQRFREDEQTIVARFDDDIDRFKTLKGLN